MSQFPRTIVGGVSVSRLIVGTNWFLGYSHCTAAKDDDLKELVRDRRRIADILDVFLQAGVDTIMGPITTPPLYDAIQEAQDRTGREAVIVSTPSVPVAPRTPVDGFDADEAARILDAELQRHVRICMPHTSTTDLLVDRCSRQIRSMDQLCRLIRQRGMIPGLSTHMPEAIILADETGLDVETYISIYNAVGFLMPLEVDWVHRIILQAQKPVMTIKPLAAGQIRPLQGLSFAWNTLRDRDMVTVGTMSPREAQECIDLSLAMLERRRPEVKLQETRSKNTVSARDA
jgi:hypothetical protein